VNLSVRTRSHSLLQLELRPNSATYTAFGLLFAAMGVLVIWGIAHRSGIVVEGGELRYERHFLHMPMDGGFVLPARAVTGIGLVLKTSWISRSYEVEVTTGETSLPTAFAMADGDQKREIAEQAWAALSAAGGSYRYEDDGTVLGLGIGLLSFAGALACWLSLQSVVLVADRSAGTFSILRKRRLLPTGTSDEIPLARVTGFRVKARTLNTGRQRVTSYQVEIRDRNGSPVPVAKGPMFTAASAEALRELLDDWLVGRGN
jgi:hypothetical protein